MIRIISIARDGFGPYSYALKVTCMASEVDAHETRSDHTANTFPPARIHTGTADLRLVLLMDLPNVSDGGSRDGGDRLHDTGLYSCNHRIHSLEEVSQSCQEQPDNAGLLLGGDYGQTAQKAPRTGPGWGRPSDSTCSSRRRQEGKALARSEVPGLRGSLGPV